MATEVIMPALEMAQETGKLIRWIKGEGETVSKGEPLMEIETDKVTVEIEAPADGILGMVTAAEGDDVPVGQTIAFVLAEGEAAPEPVVAAATAASAPTNGRDATPHRAEPAQLAESPSARRFLASPKARRLAREYAVPIEEIAGSGPYGSVQAADVLAFTASVPAAMPGAAPTTAATAGSVPIETSRAWQVMAERMVASWQQVPHFYLSRDCDATRLNSWRDAVRRREGYEKVTHTDLLVKICAGALRQHPRVNATWNDSGIVLQPGVNVGIAVATEEALIVPVVHRADVLGLREVADRRGDLVARARARKLRPEDISGGTFTISNLGMFGVDAFHAIVNAPQAAILAVGRILDRVVPVDGVATIRPTLTLTLSFDHRVVDGAEGARFLDTLAALVEEPAGLVL